MMIARRTIHQNDQLDLTYTLLLLYLFKFVYLIVACFLKYV